MNSKTILAGAMATAIAMSTPALPARADAGATAALLVGGAVGVVGLVNWSHKRKIKEQELKEQGRRQASYSSWFYRTYGVYPTKQQFSSWYYRTYGVYPS